MKISLSIPPLQRLVTYIIDNYSEMEGLCQTTGIAADVPKCVSCHSDSYYEGIPHYECQNFKHVYLLRFLITHAKQTCDLIEEIIIPGIAGQSDVKAASFGGGPGVEAIALMEQLRSKDNTYNLIFDNMDLEASWEPIYLDLVQAFAGWVRTVKIKPHFFQLDMTTRFSAGPYDIVFVPWIISEISDEDRQGVLTKARDLVQSGGYVLVTDRPQSNLVENVSALVKRIQGWSLVSEKPECEKYCGIQFPDEIRDAFWVQLNYSTAYWILQKD